MAQQPNSACNLAKTRSLRVRVMFSAMCHFVLFLFHSRSDRPFLFNPMRSSVDSFQSLISSITSMFQIRMSSANYVSSYSPGGINPGRAKCVVRRQELENFSHRETISTRQISIFPVGRRLSHVVTILAC